MCVLLLLFTRVLSKCSENNDALLRFVLLSHRVNTCIKVTKIFGATVYVHFYTHLKLSRST